MASGALDPERRAGDDRPLVIYALGAGRGHVARAARLAELIGSCTVLHHAADPPPLPRGCTAVRVPHDRDGTTEVVRAWMAQAGRVVVDTFPAGIFHELEPPPGAVLVARHIRDYARYDELIATYDEIWLPYPSDACPWEGEVRGRHVGPLVRHVRMARGRPAPLVVIGDTDALPPGWRDRLPPGTVSIDGPFDALPAARGVLAVGAGHNLCWELRALAVPVGHVPQPRRYDDQFARALRLGRAILSRRDLEVFLGAVAHVGADAGGGPAVGAAGGSR